MRVALLAHDEYAAGGAKTARAMLRYAALGWSPDTVACLIDRAAATGASAANWRTPEGVAIVADVAAALVLDFDALVIGVATAGGGLPAGYADDITAALAAGKQVVSGLHVALSADPRWAAHAERIRDVRHEHPAPRITTGEGARLAIPRVLAVGTDCSVGKMTVAIELARAARRRGLRAAFVATGQTGIMVGCDAGAPIDALVADFVPGAVERLVLDAAATVPPPDIIFIEGQGAIDHPAYAAVTAGLLHGAAPTAMVLCDLPARTSRHMPPGPVAFAKPSPARIRDLCEAHLAVSTGAKVVACARRGPGDIDLALPCADVFAPGGADLILDAVLADHPDLRPRDPVVP